jgi:hypothetical protein
MINVKFIGNDIFSQFLSGFRINNPYALYIVTAENFGIFFVILALLECFHTKWRFLCWMCIDSRNDSIDRYISKTMSQLGELWRGSVTSHVISMHASWVRCGGYYWKLSILVLSWVEIFLRGWKTIRGRVACWCWGCHEILTACVWLFEGATKSWPPAAHYLRV